MEKGNKTSFSGFSSTAEILIRIAMYVIMPFIWLYYVLAPFVNAVFSNAYGRLVKYLGGDLFLVFLAYIFKLIK
jgi:hypothetical protein